MTTLDAAPVSLYAELTRQIRGAGLLDRRPLYYTLRSTATILAYAGIWVAVVVIGASWWVLAPAALLGVAFTQLAFLGHDAGHKQIFGRRRPNELFGIVVGDLLVGISFGWWIDKHSRHHAHPNQRERDPDITTGVLVFVPDGGPVRAGAGRLWTRLQAYVFFPLLLLEGLHLHIASVRSLAGHSSRHRALEVGLFAAHTAGYFAVLFLLLSPLQAVAFVVVHQGLFGLYMGSSFAPNHKGMPILAADDDTDFLRRQVLTSRNVDGGRLIDGVFGGLNYQIEHHLFPSMPRPNLRRAQPLIQRFCEQHGVSYTRTGLFDSYRQALRHLNRAGRAASTG